MRLIPSDPDIQTLVSRIEHGDIELQPNFQRGEVWSRLKKQKLIDSILRDWHVPPIHVIENMVTKRQEVLDGQQRLAAIRDFCEDVFPIDGTIEPPDEEIEGLDGLRFSELDETWRRRVNQFAIRVFRLVEYEPGEPWELFFRLNQTTRLTGAEERNAFFGPVRDQIKGAVSSFKQMGISESLLGFSNARMAYDDVVSRTALAIQRSTLTEKITAADLTALYRRPEPLSLATMDHLSLACEKLAAFREVSFKSARLNKASVFTWLMFIVRSDWDNPRTLSPSTLIDFRMYFENQRNEAIHSPRRANDFPSPWLFYIFEDRSTARVADTSSVVLRDAILWHFYLIYANNFGRALPLTPLKAQILREVFDNLSQFDEEELSRRLIVERWGDLP